jgi:hypothetical protein
MDSSQGKRMANVLKAAPRPAKMASLVTSKVTEDVITEPKVAIDVEHQDVRPRQCVQHLITKTN